MLLYRRPRTRYKVKFPRVSLTFRSRITGTKIYISFRISKSLLALQCYCFWSEVSYQMKWHFNDYVQFHFQVKDKFQLGKTISENRRWTETLPDEGIISHDIYYFMHEKWYSLARILSAKINIPTSCVTNYTPPLHQAKLTCCFRH